MPDLGPYKNDPRIKANTDVLIETTHGPQIRVNGRFFEVHLHDSTEAVFATQALRRALNYVLGPVRKAGPDNMGGWLHTDGFTYLHDPATSGYKSADQIRVGDVIAYAGLPEVEIVERERFNADFFGRPQSGFWGRRLDTGAEGVVPYGDGAQFPVKFKV